MCPTMTATHDQFAHIVRGDADFPFDVPADRASRRDEADAERAAPPDAVADFYAHALLAGAQATAACDELSDLLETRGEHATAVLFRRLAAAEAERTGDLVRRVSSRRLPQLSRWHYHWFYNAPPDPAARELVALLMTPHAALRIAQEAWSHTIAFYERLSTTAGEAEVRTQASELAAEKSRHLRWVGDILAIFPAPYAWQDDFNGLWSMP